MSFCTYNIAMLQHCDTALLSTAVAVQMSLCVFIGACLLYFGLSEGRWTHTHTHRARQSGLLSLQRKNICLAHLSMHNLGCSTCSHTQTHTHRHTHTHTHTHTGKLSTDPRSNFLMLSDNRQMHLTDRLIFLSATVIMSMNHPVSQSASQPARQSFSQPARLPARQPIFSDG